MAGRACHVVGSATHVGLTQALGASNLELKRFSASVASGGHSTPVVAGFGRPASVTFWVAHSSAATVRSSASVTPCGAWRSEEHTSELQSLMRISYAVFCLKKKKKYNHHMT